MQLREEIFDSFLDKMRSKGLSDEQLQELREFLMSEEFSSAGLKELISKWVDEK